MTLFALLIQRCGLSLREAADFLNVRIDTVKSWSSGRNPTPRGVIDELRALYAQIERAAEEGLAQIAKMKPEAAEIGLAKSDAEAKRLGFSCVGAHGAALGIIAAKAGIPVSIVPRGSSVASAAAIKAHGI